MKKIIYSLVIMIAAGSLFTSCIEPVEPVGIFDLREAKARYYDALSKLRLADAELQLANADLVKAKAEMQRAKVEGQNIANALAALNVELQKAKDEYTKAELKLKLDSLKKAYEAIMLGLEEQIITAQLSLREAKSKMEMALLDLTEAEKKALDDAIKAYEKAYSAWVKAAEKVVKAEAALWEAQYADANAKDTNKIFYENKGDKIATGMNTEEYLEASVEYYTQKAEAAQELLDAVAENSDLPEWAAEIEVLKAAKAALEYSQYELTQDSVLYMNTVWHDGVYEFEMATEAWMEENPAVADPGPKPTEPKETDAKYNPAKFQKDPIAIPAFSYTAGKAYDKFVNMLVGGGTTNYAAVKTTAGDSTKFVIVKGTVGDTLYVNAKQEMKDFVLGNATPSTDSLEFKYYDKVAKENKTVKAKWGLEGALSVLKRDLVLDDDPGKTQEEKEKEAEDAKKQWQADHDSIALLYAAKAAETSVPEAYEPLKKAIDELKAAKDKAKTESGNLAKATEKVAARINKAVYNNTNFSYYDSTELIASFIEFAAAREAYLAYKPYQHSGVEFDNKNLFYFAKATSPRILDSVAFTALKYDAFIDDSRYSWDTSSPTPQQDAGDEAAGIAAYVRVAEALLGPEARDAVRDLNTANPERLNPNDVVLYDPAVYRYKDGKIEVYDTATSTWVEYVPAAISKAIEKVKAEVANLNALWKRYWGEDLGATADAEGKVTVALQDKYNPAVYTMATFTTPYDLVYFSADKIYWTEALGAILASVDPLKTGDNTGKNFDADHDGFVDHAGVFAGTLGKTDLYDYLWKAAIAAKGTTEDLVEIEKWVNEVKAAFEKDITDAKAAAKAAYNADKATYDAKIKTWDANKAKYDAYMEKLKAFVGQDPNGYWNYIKVTDGGKTYYEPYYQTIDEPGLLLPYLTDAVYLTQVGPFEYEGEWYIAGEQAKIAEACVPGYPEKVAEWLTTYLTTQEDILHLENVIEALEDAYVAAATVLANALDVTVTPSADITEYFKNFIEALEEEVEDCLAEVTEAQHLLDQYRAGYSDDQIKIMQLEDKLAIAEAELFDAEVRLAVAEQTYQNVLNKILGQN